MSLSQRYKSVPKNSPPDSTEYCIVSPFAFVNKQPDRLMLVATAVAISMAGPSTRSRFRHDNMLHTGAGGGAHHPRMRRVHTATAALGDMGWLVQYKCWHCTS